MGSGVAVNESFAGAEGKAGCYRAAILEPGIAHLIGMDKRKGRSGPSTK